LYFCGPGCIFGQDLLVVELYSAIRTRYSRTSRAPHFEAVKTPQPAAPESKTTAPRRGRRTLRYVLVFIGVVIVVDALVGEKGLLAMRQARQDYQSLEPSLSSAKAENERLREEARRLREDPRAVEDLARRELGLIKPGEKLFIVRDVPPAGSK
jgi:cell division protein FtsB